MTAYVFRAMTAADLPMIKRWLALPHVQEWWGDPVEQYALVSGDLDEPADERGDVDRLGGDAQPPHEASGIVQRVGGHPAVGQ